MSTATRTFGAYTFNYASTEDGAQVTIVWKDEQVFQNEFELKETVEMNPEALIENLSEADAVYMAANAFKSWMGACQELSALPVELIELLIGDRVFVLPFTDEHSERAQDFFHDTEELMHLFQDLAK